MASLAKSVMIQRIGDYQFFSEEARYDGCLLKPNKGPLLDPFFFFTGNPRKA